MCFSMLTAIGDGQKMASYKQMAGIYQQQGQTDLQLSGIAATDALNRGEQSAGQAQMQTSAALGERRTQMGAAGIDAQSGTSLEQLGATQELSAYQQAIIRNNAAREAWGLKVRGAQANQQDILKAYGAAEGADSAGWQMLGDGLKSGQELQKNVLGFAGGG